MFPTAPQCGCPKWAVGISACRKHHDCLPRLNESQEIEGAPHISDWLPEPELDRVGALQQPGAKRRITADDVRDFAEIDRWLAEQYQKPRRDRRKRRHLAETVQDGRLG